ncbi:protein of unknown function [Taphrina deformans PYCC 5710]|uniref:PITH domain-containing protein n=1 Tax=Taphrina deformans (strain PYCC 5710 / ATCC 11124 / CBS 356.35 / IMI 108563 / JCM 9778 / NBRC 8474) TaxID=1097556 RepID=R4XKE6_TAPDE|nr:protein of unknown function [Taphrina deformans PYCC 5710]|eukprot:CCG84934.1 protein of unknown function [Taphrina deformans PYCC 5710]
MSHSHGHVCEAEAQHHDHDHDHDPPPEDTNEVQSLYQKIRSAAVRTLNEQVSGSGAKIIKPWNDRFDTSIRCTSDADEQIIMHVPFDGQIKLKSILVRCPGTTSAIKEMRVYINREDLDFDTIGDAKPTETFECVPYENASDLIEYPVKIRLYNNVKSVTLFFEHNWSGDEEPTVLWYLGFRGDHTEIKDAPVAISYEAFANPKDHRVKGTEETAGRMGV